MINQPQFSVIIPHRDSIQTLPRLLASIPNDPRVEIIIVDNSLKPLERTAIQTDRKFALYYSDFHKFGGGGRNVGIEHAQGKWLLFADADDYFSDAAFNLFFAQANNEADIVYTCMEGVEEQTGKRHPRGDIYTHLVREYLTGKCDDQRLRYLFQSPCCKMLRKKLIDDNQIRFSEVLTGNDALFSVKSGYFAKSVVAYGVITYIATVGNANISRRKDYESFRCRYIEDLKINQFLRQHGVREWQYPVMVSIKQSRRYGWGKVFDLLKLAKRFNQSLFVDYNTKATYY